MSDSNKKIDPRFMAFAGCILLGVGVGFCFFPERLFVFIGCIIAGPGVGLLVAAYLPPKSGE